MKTEKPIIIQFEGEENYLTVADLVCFNMGLEIKATAQSIQAAKELFDKIEKGEIKPDIAIVSSFLERDHKDGSHVAKKLREIAPSIKLIAYTVLDDENWADELALKSGKDNNSSLISSLEKLTKKEFKMSNS